MLDEQIMRLAINQAKIAYKKKDVPVGAVIVKNGKVIAKAYNKKEKKQNATYHAEILAINKACKKVKNFRLENCTMFVTLEPCAMCCGAIIASRINKLVFGAFDENYGCAGSKYNLLQDKTFEHVVDVQGGVLQEECKELLKDFFKTIRKNKRYKNV